MQKKTKQIIALVLAVVFVAVIAIMIWSCNRVSFDLSALKYEGYDYAAISAYFNQTEKDMATETNGTIAINKINRAVNYMLNINTQYSLIQLEYFLDTSDEWAETEYRKVYNDYVEFSGKYIKILYAAMNNSSFDIFSSEEKAYILSESRFMNDDYTVRMSEISELESEYSNLEKNISVTYEGETYKSDTIPGSGPNRVDIYNAYMEAYSDAAGDVLLRMRDKYNDLAVVSYGEANYADCAYKYVYERDYTPSEVSTMSEAVKTNFKGMYFSINDKLNSSSYISTSAINSMYVNNFSSVIKTYLGKISPEMTRAYEFMDRSNLYVTGTGKNAYTGAFTSFLPEFEVPYIYQHIGNTVGDISTFIHEFGHFYAFYACGGDQGPMDTCEVQSQANEWLFMPQYENILTPESYRTFEAQSFASDVLFSLQMGCILDELQRIVYTDDSITEGSQVTALFENLLTEYGAYYDGSAYDFKYWWSMVPHTFNSPFYYISYAMSLIPSLEIYQISTTDSARAISIYNKVISDGAYKSFGDLLSYVNLSSPLKPSTISSLASFVKSRCGLV